MNGNILDLLALITLAALTMVLIIHELSTYFSNGFYRPQRFFRMVNKGPNLENSKEIIMDYLYIANGIPSNTLINVFFMEED